MFRKKNTPLFFFFFCLLTLCRVCSFRLLSHHAHICSQWKPRTLLRSGAHGETHAHTQTRTHTHPVARTAAGRCKKKARRRVWPSVSLLGENPSCQTKSGFWEDVTYARVHTHTHTLYHSTLAFEPSASTFVPSRCHFSPLVSIFSAFFCPLLSASPLLFAAHMANILSLWHHSLPALPVFVFFSRLRFFFF